MDTTLDELLLALQAEVNLEKPTIPNIITSKRRYIDWVHHRQQRIDQLLINAFIADGYVETEQRMQYVRDRLREEMAKAGQVRKSWPYPYEDVNQMKEVIAGLLAHFNTDLRVEDVIDETSGGGRKTEPYGYLLLTIFSTYIIQ